MKCVLTTAVAVMVVISAYTKDTPKYTVIAIPESLKPNPKAVYREDETIFRILSKKSARVHFHYAITILNPGGKDYAEIAISYDKGRKINDLKVFVYDANGEVIKKLKSGDITDLAASDGFSLYSDNRLKYFDLSQSTYPYTIDVEYDYDFTF